MTEPNIVFARIDNRLVHGQVGNSWVGAVNCNLIVVADDQCAEDKIQQSLMKMTADSAGVGIRFFTLQKTIDVIHKANANQHIFIVCQNPDSMRKLIEGGVPIKAVNVGNMHVKPGKKVYHEAHVYVDDKDLEDFEAMKSKGAEVYIQIAPGDKKYKI
ncbi:PTS system galactosamine-specific IIB component [Breznakia sp. PF5-3]|uniref:PTS galactosamine transporter subunit IIB n=1 Tax=unclassified Breznakia TaxID=2623764 RepID=UPI002405E45F|nr:MULTISPECIES: PTS galactosamine transporter subunit IIB [unclassified Breznakia]MDF9824763.1 PTS system galactosamine-specific IIB component [Breznakia sp. PM6-1]MDF9835670.1 PTS system galactosamine-specific IIB component [Breznakia sp. PF5-3]MDF9837719.1 PTS system galactosamine-specific IIB component [Breznakia sp. PFB2-8]MDF9859680.1 PTS system galactosamine-specific IIB component [Breznakia sp. PH5-24]